jgi:hypothetical protein
MKVICYFLKVIIILTLVGCKENKPLIQFHDQVIDIGSIQPGDSINLAFEFINSGRSDLTIINVGTGCYCANAEFSDQPVPPESSGYIRVLFVAKENKGFFEEPVIVQSNTDPQLTVLKITGFIEGI